jgi:alcohol dehydrogenase class IV
VKLTEDLSIGIPTDTVWEFRITRYKFGIGAVKEIGYDMKRFGGSKVLIVTDKGVVKAGLLDKVKPYLEEQKIAVEVWDGVEPEPSARSISKGVEWSRDRGFNLFVSIGGGSAIDSAKVINLILCHEGEILDYVAPPIGRGKPVPGPLNPHIAVPTTAGTGSETSPVCVISLPERMIKVTISHEHCRPNMAIVDPLLHVNMPPKVTADSGMDALAHAIESYVTRRFDRKPRPPTPLERPVYSGGSPLTDILAEKAIELISKYLRRAVYEGEDIKARSGMALAAALAGVAFTNAGLTALHAMSYPIGGQFHTAHGETNAALLPAVMEFFLPAAPEKFAHIAELMGESIEGLSTHDAARKSINAVIGLIKDINAPNGISVFGVKEEHIPRLVEETLKIQRLLVGSPRPTTQEDLEKLFRRALKYW